MTWVPLLLADPSPALRLLVLTQLLGRDETDGEVSELKALRTGDPLVTSLVRTQQDDGSWKAEEPVSHGSVLAVTSCALTRLGYLGFGPELPAIRRGAEYLFSRQRKDGAWPLGSDAEQDERGEGYSMVPLQTALPLRGLAACGYATDPRAERAYEWLLAQRLPDGAWPTGKSAGVHGYVAGYRRLAHSRWGCRSNTTGATVCLALHPERRRSTEARKALDLLLGRETREEHTFGFEVARMVGTEPARGFFTFFARFDPAFMLDLCSRVGATRDDERVNDLVNFAIALQGRHGLWTYANAPQVSRWLTFDLLRSLSRLDETGDWVGLEPRTPFSAYARRSKRY
jgi:hypothetical protein